MPGNPILNRIVRQTIYDLKLRFGAPVEVYHIDSAETNYRTGQKTVNRSKIDVQRCIVMPNVIARDMAQTISYISASKPFVWQGAGGWDEGTRMFIFDARDLRNYTMHIEDWIVYRNRRYDIHSIEELEYDSGWAVVGKEVLGVNPEVIIDQRVTDELEAEDSAEGEVET